MTNEKSLYDRLNDTTNVQSGPKNFKEFSDIIESSETPPREFTYLMSPELYKKMFGKKVK